VTSTFGRKSTVFAVATLAATAIAGGALAAIVSHQSTTSTRIAVTERDYTIALSKRSVPAGRITFVVHNRSRTAHRFGVKGNGVSKSIRGVIAPGKTKSLTVRLKKGRYTVYCPIHVAQGMKTTLKVGGSTGSPGTTTSGGGWG